MKFGWKLFRIVCFLQLLTSVLYGFIALISTFREGDLNYLIQAAAFFLMAWFAGFAVQTLNEHYPDVPVSGKTKSTFNWLFLLNFLLLAFLFGLLIREYRALEKIAVLINRKVWNLPSEMFTELIAYTAMLVFQILILYGMYSLRVLLFRNYHKKTFEFEEHTH